MSESKWVVWVVMDEWKIEDDGNADRDIHSVHATHDGAISTCQDPDEGRHLYVVEMEVEQ